MVRSEPLFPSQRGALDRRNSEGEEAPHPKRSHRSFHKTPLGNFDKFTLQVHLNNLAKTNSKDRVLQIRAYLRDIFAEAVDQDFLVKDPARKVTSRLSARHRSDYLDLDTVAGCALKVAAERTAFCWNWI